MPSSHITVRTVPVVIRWFNLFLNTPLNSVLYMYSYMFIISPLSCKIGIHFNAFVSSGLFPLPIKISVTISCSALRSF